MRLCDLDEIKICVDRQYENCHGYSGSKKAIYREAILAVKSILHSAKPIDAVPVVRCENCKYGYPCGDEIVCYHPEYELAEGKWSYKKDFFCAFGDTKEGADNG